MTSFAFDESVSVSSSLSSSLIGMEESFNEVEPINDESSDSNDNYNESEFESVSEDSMNPFATIINDSTLSEISQEAIIDEIDEIHNMDYQHLYSEKQNGKYYIGLCNETMQNHSLNMPPNSIYLMVNSVSPDTYFKWSHISCLRYLYYYGMIPMHNPKIEIMQLHILQDQTYSVIIKTFWLKIIQRKWKKIFKIRKNILASRYQRSSIYYREVHGVWPEEIRNIPGLTGLLCY